MREGAKKRERDKKREGNGERERDKEIEWERERKRGWRERKVRVKEWGRSKESKSQ